MTASQAFPIGRPGQPWNAEERGRWRDGRRASRSFFADVLPAIERLRGRGFDVVEYGRVDVVGDGEYPLLALRSRAWDESRPIALVTGGVHGYETSGVHGALRFADCDSRDYTGRINLLVVPCVSPWAYERIQRWNAEANDPNRNFKSGSGVPESEALVALVGQYRGRFLMHIDLHETTDSDEGEFRPALAARDGKVFEPGLIPDGFYLVDDTANPRPAFQQAILREVEKVTHIAPADDKGEIIGSTVVAPGVIEYPFVELGLCAGLTAAKYTTTTEVYPDSPRATPEQCIAAQVAAVRGALDFVLAASADD